MTAATFARWSNRSATNTSASSSPSSPSILPPSLPTREHGNTATSKEPTRTELSLSLASFSSSSAAALGTPHYGVPFLIANVDIAAAKTLAHAGELHLWRDELERDAEAYGKCVWAANASVGVINSLTDGDYELVSPMLAVSLFLFLALLGVYACVCEAAAAAEGEGGRRS